MACVKSGSTGRISTISFHGEKVFVNRDIFHSLNKQQNEVAWGLCKILPENVCGAMGREVPYRGQRNAPGEPCPTPATPGALRGLLIGASAEQACLEPSFHPSPLGPHPAGRSQEQVLENPQVPPEGKRSARSRVSPEGKTPGACKIGNRPSHDSTKSAAFKS